MAPGTCSCFQLLEGVVMCTRLLSQVIENEKLRAITALVHSLECVILLEGFQKCRLTCVAKLADDVVIRISWTDVIK